MINRKHLIQILVALIATFVIAGGVFAQGAPDRDGDGVIDDDDRCISVPGPASNNGCPERAGSNDDDTGRDNSSNDDSSSDDDGSSEPPPPDSDGDGTADPLDQCPMTPGDGANYGCPEGQTNDDAPQTIELVPMPSAGDCVASPNGTFNANMRELPEPGANILGILAMNEMGKVWGVVFPQGQTDAWYLIEGLNTTGWVNGNVLRFGGDCSDYTFDNGSIVMGSNTVEATLCEILNPEVGVYIVNCNPTTPETDEDDNTVTYCVIELGDEAGMYEENCYEIEIPEGCVLLQPEYGVYILDCEETPDAYLKLGNQGGEMPEYDPELPLQSIDVPEGETVEICMIVQGAEAGMYEEVCFEFEIPEGCVLLQPEYGVYILDCEEVIDQVQTLVGSNGNASAAMMGKVDNNEYFTYCVIELGDEAGMYEEVCYTIIVPDGCTVVSPEVGIYILDCEEDNVPVNPQLGELPNTITQLVETTAETTRE